MAGSLDRMDPLPISSMPIHGNLVHDLQFYPRDAWPVVFHVCIPTEGCKFTPCPSLHSTALLVYFELCSFLRGGQWRLALKNPRKMKCNRERSRPSFSSELHGIFTRLQLDRFLRRSSD